MRPAGLALTLMAGLFAGCGPPASLGPAAVRGRVLFRGQPLAGGTICFSAHPDRGPVVKPASAEIGPDGEFRLETAGRPAYLPAGWYRVALADPPAGTDAFPAALRRPDRSGLDREVVAGKDNVFEFHIELTPGN